MFRAIRIKASRRSRCKTENAMKTQTRKKLIEKGRIRFIVNYADGFALLDFYMAFGATAY